VNRARGKSGRHRSVPTTKRLVAALRDYQLERDRVPRADLNDYVFVNLSGTAAGQAMSYSNVFQVLARAARRAGVSRLHPHQFRHTAATAWLHGGATPDVVQALLGHASAASTAVYLHASDEDKRTAVDRIAALREQAAQ